MADVVNRFFFSILIMCILFSICLNEGRPAKEQEEVASSTAIDSTAVSEVESKPAVIDTATTTTTTKVDEPTPTSPTTAVSKAEKDEVKVRQARGKQAPTTTTTTTGEYYLFSVCVCCLLTLMY